MLDSVLDAVMERRSEALIELVGAWLPAEGPLLDLGSGTGHLSARLEREFGIEVVPADVSDLHVRGRPPVAITDGSLPFEAGHCSAALLAFMLHYPRDPVGLLVEVARVSRGPIILVQSLYASRAGYLWLRVREFAWTYVAFHVSRLIGYIPATARFSMSTRRFYSEPMLRQHVAQAGLRIQARRERPVLPARALVVAAWMLARDD